MSVCACKQTMSRRPKWIAKCTPYTRRVSRPSVHYARTLYPLTVALERDSISAKREQLAALKAQVGAIQSLMANVSSSGVSVSGALIQLCSCAPHMPAPVTRIVCAVRTCNLCAMDALVHSLCVYYFAKSPTARIGRVCGDTIIVNRISPRCVHDKLAVVVVRAHV
jgi:hypothetical protein